MTGLAWNVGNQTSCNVQGFLIQLKIANPFYNSALALYFLLMIRYGWKEGQLWSIERFMHLLPIVMAFGTSTASLLLNQFNNANLWCWIAAYPLSCEGSHRGEPCERGDDAWIYRLAFFYTWYWASLVFVTIAMFLVYWTVRVQERASGKFAMTSNSKKRNTKRVATQAMLYIVAYFLSASFATLTRVIQEYVDTVPFGVILCMTILYPMQGFFNFLIYIRPRYLRYQQRHPDWSLGTAIGTAFKRALSGDIDIHLGTTCDNDAAVVETTPEANCENDPAVVVSSPEGNSEVDTEGA